MSVALTYSLYFVLLAVAILFLLIKRSRSYWKNRNVPYDEPHWFFGNLEGFSKKKHFIQVFREFYDKHKGKAPFAGFYFFMSPAVFVLDLDLVKNILIKDFSNFADRGLYCNEKDDPLTGHLFLLNGKRWKELRTIVSPTFTSGKMKFMYPTMLDVGHRFTDVLQEVIKEDSVVEIKDLLARFTTDVIGTCAFGIDCNSLKDPQAEFRKMGRKIFSEPRNGRIGEAFIRGCPDLARKLHMKLIPDDLSKFFMNVVLETVAYREENNVKRNDFMDMLIDLKNTKSAVTGEPIITIEELAAQAFVFFLAGFETSSTTMMFSLYELAINTDIQDRLRVEINDALKAHNGEFSYECMTQMKYLDQVISETLRKHSVVPMLFRRALADYKVPDSNLVIEKNTLVIIPADGIHMDPDIYPNPTEFNPDRFTPDEVLKRHACSWLPFGDGPRNCIGLRFGKMQTRIGLALLLKNFKFTVCPKTPIPLVMDPKSRILSAVGGIFLRVESV